jgi:hypothetical protein
MLRIGRGVTRASVKEAVARRVPDTVEYADVLEGDDIREAVAGLCDAGLPEGSIPLLAWLAAHPNAPEDVLRDLRRLDNSEVLIGLAMNRSLPDDLRKELMSHPDEDVHHYANKVFFKGKRH